jgi:hypothetical protein
MRRGILSFTLIVVLAAVIGLAAPSASALTVLVAPIQTFGCTEHTYLVDGSVTFDRDNTGSGVESYTIQVTDGDGTVLRTFSGAFSVGTTTGFGLGPRPYDVALPSHNPIIYQVISNAGNGLPALVQYEDQGICPGLPYAAVAGCVAGVAIPPQAVMARFNDNAQVFFAPQADAGTNIVITVGKTYLMAGVDESGVYAQVLVSCEWVWVELAKLGPTYDEPWNGAPLPGTVVD